VLLPVGQLHTGKEEPHGIERDNARQRHWLARFRRRSIVVSKAKRMVDVSIALFARFAGNNRIADLISMLSRCGQAGQRMRAVIPSFDLI
jgi:insertion element IS1 protein InsB